MAYDPFLRKDCFEDQPWYNQFCIFCAIGVCEVPNAQVNGIREALARFLYATRVTPGKNPGSAYIIGDGAIEPGDMDACIQGIRGE